MPVLTGSATANVGVPQMLDFVADYFPSPVDVGSVEAYEGEKAVEVKPNLDDPFSALCFKVMQRLPHFLYGCNQIPSKLLDV